MKICIDCFITEEEVSTKSFYDNCPQGSIGGSPHRMMEKFCGCIRCHQLFISVDFYGEDMERCESSHCQGYRKGFAEALKVPEYILFPIPRRQCSSREGGGNRCEKEAGHKQPCACPKALERYLNWQKQVQKTLNEFTIST